jgi:steroid 5-alpha reductase family enzyme
MKEQISWEEAGRGAAQVGAATVAFALWHSFLCARGTKERVQSLLGERRGKGLYRLGFNLQALACTGALALWILSRPHRLLYDAKAPIRLGLWAGQVASLAVCLSALWAIGARRFSGLHSLQHLSEGREQVFEPEAQGPPLDDGGQVDSRGVFRWSRHPLEWAPMLVLWLSPTLKTNWLAFTALGTAYSLWGARHEEERLERVSGDSFREYQQQAAFFVGLPAEPQE